LEDLYIHHHLGLGDHVCLNGLVRKYAKEHSVFLFCKLAYYECIKFMYRDTSIEIIPIHMDGVWNITNEVKIIDGLANGKFLRIGFDNIGHIRKNNPDKGCDEWFYIQCGADYNTRFDGFYVERDYAEEERVYKKLNPDNQEYSFVHDDASRGYKIDVTGNTIRNDVSENLFYMGLTIERAKEVHLMESAIRCYIEHLSPTGILYYHDIREVSMCKNSTRKQWMNLNQ